jgi:hypothetical protein
MRKSIDTLLLAVVLTATWSMQMCEASSKTGGNLRRKRNDKQPETQVERTKVHDSEFMLEPEEHLEDLWNRAMTVDETEAKNDRYLQMSLSFSMATKPPTPPLPTTPLPTGGPTPTPAPSLVTPTLNPTLNPTSSPSGGDSSMAPSANCLTGTTREAFLLDVLSAVTATSLLLDPLTPQGQAFTWIVADPLMFDPCTYPTIDQRYGLATFFFGTAGSLWIDNTDWIGGVPECQWFGITCDPMTNTTVEKLQLRKLSNSILVDCCMKLGITNTFYLQH